MACELTCDLTQRISYNTQSRASDATFTAGSWLLRCPALVVRLYASRTTFQEEAPDVKQSAA